MKRVIPELDSLSGDQIEVTQIAASHRRGAVMVWFAVVTLVLLALTSLILDVGNIVLARRQMVGASETTALTALRYSRSFPDWIDETRFDPEITAELSTTFGSDPEADIDKRRRFFARHLLRASYDDDFDFDTSDPLPADNEWSIGAGAAIDFAGGIPLTGTSLKAGEQIVGIGPYRPDVQLNPRQGGSFNDATDGDIVDGAYLGESVGPGDTSTTGQRDDFDNSDPADASAVLVRIRRSAETSAGPNEVEPTPRVPMLFSRGLIGTDEIGAAVGSDLSARGAVVRSNAIAEQQFAVSIGPAQALTTGDVLGGYYRIVLNETQYIPGGSVTVTQVGSDLTSGGTPVGELTEQPAVSVVVGDRVGVELVRDPSAFVNTFASFFVALRNDPTSGDGAIIGFGLIAQAEIPSPGQLTITFAAAENQFAAENALTRFPTYRRQPAALASSAFAIGANHTPPFLRGPANVRATRGPLP